MYIKLKMSMYLLYDKMVDINYQKTKIFNKNNHLNGQLQSYVVIIKKIIKKSILINNID